jgi:EAL domain-containing protein (putative c-di-GMP-specific phosphodiesterase class I)
VETAQQLVRVMENGCSCVQGYYFSRPVPACAIRPLLEKFTAPAAFEPIE